MPDDNREGARHHGGPRARLRVLPWPGGEGTSDVYFPRLAGKPAGYLYNQLMAFRDGRRRYPPMNYLLEFLPDAYLQADGATILRRCGRRFRAPAVPDVSKEMLARGEALVEAGRSAARHSRLRGLPRPEP